MKFNKKQNFGFTLVETLVAIAILSLSVMATSAAVQNGLSVSYYARDEVTAYYLIQEAVEYVRNIRDQNALSNISSISSGGAGVNWLTNISLNSGDPCYFGKFCVIDAPQNTMTTCPTSSSASSCPYLNQTANGLFSYSAGTTSKFKRTLQINQINANEIVLTVSVSWVDNANKNASVSVQEWLLNTR
jgi:prepilin-type N-terminal cleavage/methylation domain-containing protein